MPHTYRMIYNPSGFSGLLFCRRNVETECSTSSTDAHWNDGGDNDMTWNPPGDKIEFDTGDFGGGKEFGGGDDACRNLVILLAIAPSLARPLELVSTVVKKECTKPRVFKGACRTCDKEGHPASECPDKPADVCKNCKQEGHKTMDCTQNRKFDQHHIPDKLPEEAWAILKKASDEKDLEDFRDGIKIYSKAVPMATFDEIERKMREENFEVYLIGLDKEIADCHTLINLQGKLNCKFVVGYYFGDKPQRPNLKERWPQSSEENLKRLADAGIPLDRQIPKCVNCGQMGHGSRACPDERSVVEKVEVKCVNCNGMGHRARDCTEKRIDKFSCRNCGEEGHISKECDKPHNLDTVTCRNCEEVGHYSRDCTKKKDWTKVQCNNCKEMGHTVRRCPKPVEGENAGDGFGDYGFGNNPGYDDMGGSRKDDGAFPESTPSWMNAGDGGTTVPTW
ncbi:zinc knuckle transcription factor [Histoplasma capsulatum var. duboisii H88]|uniref:Zinc knuckle transcription factor n=2 Tax=Ajellomyces capsulatus TaxID=5037 RepID=F0U600_AJEC8|nr:zinc knuckle transcription factor [Histoplasma capsulatum H143]EGC41391.1 zinc knuckle transcription factor [Histoplasma capsulatum var. duboisii H88]